MIRGEVCSGGGPSLQSPLPSGQGEPHRHQGHQSPSTHSPGRQTEAQAPSHLLALSGALPSAASWSGGCWPRAPGREATGEREKHTGVDSGRRGPSTTLPPLRLHPQSSCGRGREPRWGRTGEREAPAAGSWGRPVAFFLPVAGSLLERTPWTVPPRSAVLPAIPLLGASPSPRRWGLCVQGLTPPPSAQGRHTTRGPRRPNTPSLAPGPGRPRAQLRGFRSEAPPRCPPPGTPVQ